MALEPCVLLGDSIFTSGTSFVAIVKLEAVIRVKNMTWLNLKDQCKPDW